MSESKKTSNNQISSYENILLSLIAKSEVQGAILHILIKKYLSNEDKELIREIIHNSQSTLKNKQELSHTDKIVHEKQLKYLDSYLPKS